MLSESENNACTIVDIFCEFVEIAIHSILHARKLYPESIFERKRKYGVVVYHSIHPGVNEYILKCVEAINFHLKRNQLKSIFLCFNTPESVLEKYTFQVLKIENCFESDPFLVKVEKYLSDFCLQLASSISHLDFLVQDCTFSIQLQVSEFGDLELRQDPLHEDFPWVTSSVAENNQTFNIIPLPSVDTDFLNLRMHIENYNRI